MGKNNMYVEPLENPSVMMGLQAAACAHESCQLEKNWHWKDLVHLPHHDNQISSSYGTKTNNMLWGPRSGAGKRMG